MIGEIHLYTQLEKEAHVVIKALLKIAEQLSFLNWDGGVVSPQKLGETKIGLHGVATTF